MRKVKHNSYSELKYFHKFISLPRNIKGFEFSKDPDSSYHYCRIIGSKGIHYGDNPIEPYNSSHAVNCINQLLING